MARSKPKKRSSHRSSSHRSHRFTSSGRLASMSRGALLKEYKRLRPHTPKKTLEALRTLPREALLGRVILASRPKTDPRKKYEGMSRREMIDLLASRRGGKGKKAGKKKGGFAKKAKSVFSSSKSDSKYEDAEINALLAEQKREDAARYAASFNRDPGGRRLSAYAKFVKVFAKTYRGSTKRGGLMKAASRAWAKMSERQKAKYAAMRLPRRPKKASAKRPKKRSSRRDYGWY